MGFTDEIKMQYRSGSLLVKLIFINIGVFVALKLAMFVLLLFGADSHWVASFVELPSAWQQLLTRPWTVLTYMFMHADLFHIFFNMLCLYWFGMVFMEFNTPKQLVALYVLSGLMGAAFFLCAYNFLPAFEGRYGTLVGASAAVYGVMVAACMRAPNYRMHLLFVGAVPLKWILAVMIIIDLISFDGSNFGGHVAHLGGIAMGAIYALMLRRGHDVTKWINKAIDAIAGLFSRRRQPMGRPVRGGGAGGSRYHYAKAQTEPEKPDFRSEYVTREQAEIDAILEKIKVSGYSSLTDEEKRKIFTAGKKN